MSINNSNMWNTSLICIRNEGRKSPLVLISDLSASIHIYRDLAIFFNDHPVYSFHTPGLRENEAIINNIIDLSKKYAHEIMNTFPNTPIKLGGYCLGCVIALEVANQLEKIGITVNFILLIGPSIQRSIVSHENTTAINKFAHEQINTVLAENRRVVALEFVKRMTNVRNALLSSAILHRMTPISSKIKMFIPSDFNEETIIHLIAHWSQLTTSIKVLKSSSEHKKMLQDKKFFELLQAEIDI
ncbi:thioesterase domain-containing protein [Iodobacter sp.]|uniref:thioesterase domain-containing protein n=1 Tax=Iodobacter sp. TaxID=1915058 RepID=UPI0025E7C854|nr:thioesterase domain-containing protein [Iodobacter sp.]